MTIEIRELVIRARVNNQSSDNLDNSSHSNADKKAVVAGYERDSKIVDQIVRIVLERLSDEGKGYYS